jgi:putative FmdB family regulatory protein
MPIYEYRCESCGHELEKLQRMKDDPLRDCPGCGASALRRLVSAAGFRLKGSGWYETDFKQGGKRNLAESSQGSKGSKNGADAGTGGKPGKSGDKPADKPVAGKTAATKDQAKSAE